MTATLTAQTPDEWLLERFDAGEGYPEHRMWQRRQMFEVIDDHTRTECSVNYMSYFSGQASWPTPAIGRDVLSGVLGSRNELFRELMLEGVDE